jgi:hypothetical protein
MLFSVVRLNARGITRRDGTRSALPKLDDKVLFFVRFFLICKLYIFIVIFMYSYCYLFNILCILYYCVVLCVVFM